MTLKSLIDMSYNKLLAMEYLGSCCSNRIIREFYKSDQYILKNKSRGERERGGHKVRRSSLVYWRWIEIFVRYCSRYYNYARINNQESKER